MKPLLYLFALFYVMRVMLPDQTDPPLDESDTVAILKASYIFKFATSNDWPESVKKGAFKIAIYGSENVFRELTNKYATKPIGSQNLEVTLLEKPELPEFYHVVFVAGKDAEGLKKIVKSSAGQPTLLVSDGRDNLKNGSTISFVTVDNTTRYIINTDEAQKRKISLGSTIILWAVSN